MLLHEDTNNLFIYLLYYLSKQIYSITIYICMHMQEISYAGENEKDQFTEYK